MKIRVIVCGGRDYDDRDAVFSALDRLHAEQSIDCVIHGGGMGADYLAFKWALDRGVVWRCFPADWKKYGRSAGPIRNQQMIDEGEPDVVVAFPGGNGTADMMKRAKRAGLEILEPIRPQ